MDLTRVLTRGHEQTQRPQVCAHSETTTCGDTQHGGSWPQARARVLPGNQTCRHLALGVPASSSLWEHKGLLFKPPSPSHLVMVALENKHSAVAVQLLSRVQLFEAPWTAAGQTLCPPLSPRVCSNPRPSSGLCPPTTQCKRR